MRKPAKIVSTLASLAALSGALAMGPSVAAAAEEMQLSAAEQGKKIAFSKKKGNCLACHAMDDGVSPGDMGPPLIAMKQRFPDRARLKAQLYDATQFNPDSPMPPFGKYRILSDDEIDKVVDYLYTL